MAELVVTQDELALRRRARRRLVGAVAIALTVIVVLPMLFDSEPKPLGPEVDIRIPAQDTPFEAAPPLAPAVPIPTPIPTPAPTQNAVPALPAEPTQTSAQPESGSRPAEVQKPVALETAKTAAVNAAQTKPESEAKAKAEVRPKPDKKSEAKPEAKPVLKADTPFASQGYFLQLGAFGSESNARQLLAKATDAGFNAALLGANGQFRVRVGPIPQHARALEIQARLKAKGFKPVLLGP